MLDNKIRQYFQARPGYYDWTWTPCFLSHHSLHPEEDREAASPEIPGRVNHEGRAGPSSRALVKVWPYLIEHNQVEPVL